MMNKKSVSIGFLCLLTGITCFAGAGGFNDDGLKFGAEADFFSYEEPGVMKESGVLPGLSVAYDHTIAERLTWGLFSSIVGGDLNYDGSVMHADGSSTPLELTTPNSIFNIRAHAGIRASFNGIVVVPYSGIAYRLLIDDLAEASAAYGYTREQTYVYLPIGARVAMPLANGWLLEGRVEYDYFIQSENNSHDGVLGAGYVFNQDTGYGLKLSALIASPTKNRSSFCIEPFLEYWDVGDSEIIDGYMEPSNHSSIFGLRFAVKLF